MYVIHMAITPLSDSTIYASSLWRIGRREKSHRFSLSRDLYKCVFWKSATACPTLEEEKKEEEEGCAWKRFLYDCEKHRRSPGLHPFSIKFAKPQWYPGNFVPSYATEPCFTYPQATSKTLDKAWNPETDWRERYQRWNVRKISNREKLCIWSGVVCDYELVARWGGTRVGGKCPVRLYAPLGEKWREIKRISNENEAGDSILWG